jgi:hypothetical protein
MTIGGLERAFRYQKGGFKDMLDYVDLAVLHSGCDERVFIRD